LPEEVAPEDRFREMPVAIPQPNHKTLNRFTHIVIDEAQDLSVQEASFLGSLVHPRGSLTVSADFHQVVSPVHGMTDAEALKFGIPIVEQDAFKQYPFTKNMRQSHEIGLFLVDFYKKVFHEFPKFDAGDRVERIKPTLYVGSATRFPKLIQQMLGVLARSKQLASVAVLQVNEDAVALELLREKLVQLGVSVAPLGSMQGAPGQLLMTDVEHAKGLEFDVCIVLGLDDVERSALNFSRNRAYVALSRPTQRLFMLCEQFPPLLEKVESDLYERRDI
jgi:DNA helicase IV